MILWVTLLLPMAMIAQNLQSKYNCLYEYKVHTDKGVTETYNTMLQLAESQALFLDYQAFQLDSLIQQKATDEQIDEAQGRVMRAECFFDQAVAQNDPKGKLTVYGTITPNYYVYNEDMNLNWQPVDKTDTICGYLCKQATVRYGGRNWTAWYAPDIPLPYGPFKFTGLPGLILKITDQDNIHCFEAIQFRQSTNEMTKLNYPNAIATSRDKYLKAKNKFEKNPKGNLPMESISQMEVHKTADGKNAIFVNGVQLRMRANGYVPIEIE